MVFVGYGIVADELSHNDYKDLDVKGKIVVALRVSQAIFHQKALTLRLAIKSKSMR